MMAPTFSQKLAYAIQPAGKPLATATKPSNGTVSMPTPPAIGKRKMVPSVPTPPAAADAQAASAAMRPSTKTAAIQAILLKSASHSDTRPPGMKKAPRYSKAGKKGKKIMPLPHRVRTIKKAGTSAITGLAQKIIDSISGGPSTPGTRALASGTGNMLGQAALYGGTGAAIGAGRNWLRDDEDETSLLSDMGKGGLIGAGAGVGGNMVAGGLRGAFGAATEPPITLGGTTASPSMLKGAAWAEKIAFTAQPGGGAEIPDVMADMGGSGDPRALDAAASHDRSGFEGQGTTWQRTPQGSTTTADGAGSFPGVGGTAMGMEQPGGGPQVGMEQPGAMATTTAPQAQAGASGAMLGGLEAPAAPEISLDPSVGMAAPPPSIMDSMPSMETLMTPVPQQRPAPMNKNRFMSQRTSDKHWATNYAKNPGRTAGLAGPAIEARGPSPIQSGMGAGLGGGSGAPGMAAPVPDAGGSGGMAKAGAGPPSSDIVDMDSFGGKLGDYLRAGSWGGERSGRSQAMAAASGQDTNFNVRHPLSHQLLSMLGGGSVGGLLGGGLGFGIGALSGGGPRRTREAASLGALIGGGGGLVGGGLLSGLLRRAKMKSINRGYDKSNDTGTLDPQDPKFNVLSALLLPGRGPHRSGQAEAVSAMRNESTIPDSRGRRDALYAAPEIMNLIPGGGLVAAPAALAHGWAQNYKTQMGDDQANAGPKREKRTEKELRDDQAKRLADSKPETKEEDDIKQEAALV